MLRVILAILLLWAQSAEAQTGRKILLMGSPLWSPANIASVCPWWWDANKGVTISTGVSVWIDRNSGLSATQGTGANQPGWSATARNGKPGLTFNGSNQFLSFTPTGFPSGANASTMALAAFTSVTAGATVQFPLTYGAGSTSAGQSRVIFQQGTADPTPSSIGAGTSGAGGNVNAVELWTNLDRLAVYQISGQNESLNIDGNAATTATAVSTTNTLLASGSIGWWPFFGNKWNGTIQQIVVCNSLLTTSQRQKLEGWESWYDGKSGSNLPASHPYKARPPTVNSADNSPNGASIAFASFPLSTPPFSAASLWNTPIAVNATYTPMAWPANTGGNYWVNWDSYSAPVYVASPSDPDVTVSIPQPRGGYPAGSIHVRIPKGATGATGTDGELIVVDQNQVYSFWIFSRTDDANATAQAYGVSDVFFETGWGNPTSHRYAGITAAGSSVLAGMLVQSETDVGPIRHALQISLDFTLQKPGFLPPAVAGDGSSPGGLAQEGSRFGIPPSTQAPSGLSDLGKKVFSALVTYGAYDIDVAGATNFRAQQNSYDGATITALRNDVKSLVPLLQMVN